MKTYIYPSDLKVSAAVWMWALRDLVILLAAAVLSIFLLVSTHSTLFLALTVAYAVATARVDGRCIADYAVVAFRYFVSVPQTYLWRSSYEQKNDR